jgi:hypothetical protein
MYVDIGGDILINEKDIVGLFDLDNTTTNKYTNKFLVNKEKYGKLFDYSHDIPKSFLLLQDGSVIFIEYSGQIMKKRFEEANK